MADGVDIDLYADDIEQEFNQDGDYNHDGGGVDLYDDVITAPSNSDHGQDDFPELREKSSSSSINSSHSQHGGKRIALYVGNLTWWTTDQDITDAIQALGVSELIEIKFYENRANGQSKGFCVITLGSESASRIVMDKLPKKDLHGQNPIVTHCNRQTLNQFEMQSRKSNSDHGKPGSSWSNFELANAGMGRRSERGERSRGPYPPGQRNSNSERFGGMMQGPGGPYQSGRGMPHGGPPPSGPQGPPPRPGMPPPGPPGGPPLPPGMQGPPPPRQGGPIPHGMPPRGPPPPVPRGPPPPDPRGPPPPRPDWDRPPALFPPQHAIPPPGVPPPHHQGHPPNRPHAGMVSMEKNFKRGPPPGPPGPHPHGPPPGHHHPPPPAPHVNPAFFSQQGPPPQPHMPPHVQGDGYGRTPPSYDFRPPADMRPDPGPPPISEAEFEEIMSRNKTVSSSAIARAVADASAGEYASAIETLVTAISLIKQSKVSNDDRCKILISSLQDTLHGIEAKSYGSSNKERGRSRERSRERSSRREKSSRRAERSRSRDRDYRERSRDRERYHEDRHREKERERDRERDYRRH